MPFLPLKLSVYDRNRVAGVGFGPLIVWIEMYAHAERTRSRTAIEYYLDSWGLFEQFTSP
ncbi:hypothetical protein C8039_07810 [Halogeometricum sp. wsp3]|nr:hypothetical protein C8039_07810 [Halogeometricum sp. wsp3]